MCTSLGYRQRHADSQAGQALSDDKVFVLRCLCQAAAWRVSAPRPDHVSLTIQQVHIPPRMLVCKIEDVVALLSEELPDHGHIEFTDACIGLRQR